MKVVSNQKVFIAVTCFLCMILSACSGDSEAEKSHGILGGSPASEALHSEETPTIYDITEQLQLANVSEYYELGEEIEIKSEFSDITKVISEIYITKTFEEDMAEWNTVATGMEDVEAQDKTITNGFSIIYIEGTVTNHADKEEIYGLSSVRIMRELDGALWGIFKELGYSNLMGTGKSAQILKLQPGESKEFRLGYLVPDEYLDSPLYVEVTGISGSEDYKVIPFGEK